MVDKNKFKYNNLSKYEINDWDYKSRHELLTQLSKEEIFHFFPKINKNEIEFIKENYHFFSWNNNKEFTVLIDDEICCGELHLIQLDSIGNKLSDEVIAGVGGDGGWSYHQSGEFVNDSIYEYCVVNYETVIDNEKIVEYKVDSTIYSCSYTPQDGLEKRADKRFEYLISMHNDNLKKENSLHKVSSSSKKSISELEEESQNEINEFMNHFKLQVKNEIIDSIMSNISFPLSGEWGFVLGFNNGGESLTKSDFVAGFDKIFTTIVKKELIENEYEVHISDSNKVEILIGTSTSKDSEFESSRLFRFKKIRGKYKMYLIFHAG